MVVVDEGYMGRDPGEEAGEKGSGERKLGVGSLGEGKGRGSSGPGRGSRERKLGRGGL